MVCGWWLAALALPLNTPPDVLPAVNPLTLPLLPCVPQTAPCFLPLLQLVVKGLAHEWSNPKKVSLTPQAGAGGRAGSLGSRSRQAGWLARQVRDVLFMCADCCTACTIACTLLVLLVLRACRALRWPSACTATAWREACCSPSLASPLQVGVCSSVSLATALPCPALPCPALVAATWPCRSQRLTVGADPCLNRRFKGGSMLPHALPASEPAGLQVPCCFR